MIKHYPYHTLDQADYGWLESRHHFSFACYHKSERIGFGAMFVINDDWVQPGTGFDLHPHRNMEIISYIPSGAFFHQDSKGITRVLESSFLSVIFYSLNSSDNRSKGLIITFH